MLFHTMYAHVVNESVIKFTVINLGIQYSNEIFVEPLNNYHNFYYFYPSYSDLRMKTVCKTSIFH